MTLRHLCIAVFHDHDVRIVALARRLSSMGYQAVACTEVADLLQMARRGRFDLLLIPSQRNLISKLLPMGPEVLAVPALLLVQQHCWDDLSLCSKSFGRCDMFDFDAVRTTDRELCWRLHSLHSMHVQQSSKRTVAGAPPKGAEAAGMVRGDYCFLERRRVVLHREREVLLQPREFEFALQLFQNVGRVLTREWLRESIWRARHHREDSRVLDVCAANLRRKLALQSENGFVLKAVYKTGYCLFEMPLDSAPAEKKARGHQWLLPSNEPETAA